MFLELSLEDISLEDISLEDISLEDIVKDAEKQEQFRRLNLKEFTAYGI